MIIPLNTVVVKVKNPFFKSYVDHVLVESTSDNKFFIVSSALLPNSENLDICIRNRDENAFFLPKKSKICKISFPHDVSLNPVTLKCDLEEQSELDEFQKHRKSKYCNTPKMPSVGQIGNLLPAQRSQLDNLLLKNYLSFSWGPEDLGKCHGYRFVLLMSRCL